MMRRLLFAGLLAFMVHWAFPPDARGENLVATNSTWRWLKGTNEASNPVSAWRARTYNDSAWPSGQAPFYYHTGGALSGNTHLPDMPGGYNCIFLRRPFVISNRTNVSSLALTVLIDDGFIVWINGTEVRRYNVMAGEPVYTNGTPSAVAPTWQTVALTNTSAYLVNGTNVIAVQAVNRNFSSSDFILDLELTSILSDVTPPVITTKNPAPGTISSLTQVAVTFSEPVTGVGFSDLLLNGVPAVSLYGSGASYIFTVDQPPPGTIQASWAPETQIKDLSGNPFDRSAPQAAWQYLLLDLVPPTMLVRTPSPGAAVLALTRVEVTFTEPVTGLQAGDLLINGNAATNFTGTQAGPYVFTFPPPAPGLVPIAWASGHGITDLANSPNAFAGGSWNVTVDPTIPTNTIRINEFVAANAAGLIDEDDEASDWIELYNFGTQPINLSGWSLSDVETDPGQWVFPEVQLAPGQFLVVFASGKDRRSTTPGARLHTNFRLGSDGEFLGLFSPMRAPISTFTPKFPEQRTDIAFGYAGTTLRYLSPPTPGAPNGASSITGMVSAVVANVARGVFNHPFTLVLATATPGATIRYTLDGSEPSLVNGLTYSEPLTIDTTRILRAAAFLDNHLPSRPVTHTYIFPGQVLSQSQNPAGFPSTWGSWPLVDYEMDPEIVYDPRFQSNILASLQSFPTLSVVMNVDEMFGGQGIYSNPTRETPAYPVSAVEKACSAELIHPDGTPGFQIDCGIRIQGGASRTPSSNPKHSLRLLFKSDYGPGKLDYSFFPDSPVSSFNTLILRGEYNNSWIHWDPVQRLQGTNARDQWGRNTQLATSGLASHGNYVHLYINGLYWGLYNPSERPDASFAASYLGGTAEEYDAIKQPVAADDGDLVAWNAMMSIVRGGLGNNSRYEALQQYLDIDHFADYMIVNIYGGNADWPHNNWTALRRRMPGAQFKFVCWDIERTLESPVRTNEFTVSNANSPAEIYAGLRSNAEFRLRFADRLHRHFFNGGALTVDANINRYSNLSVRVDQAVQAESARWGDYRRDVDVRGTAYLFTYPDHWIPEKNRLLNTYFPQRSSFVLSRFQAINLYPAVVAPVFQQHGGRVARSFPLTITAQGGNIYYTTNGSDPRVYGTSAVSPDAQLYDDPVILTHSLTVKARALVGGVWSALNEAAFQVGEIGLPLCFTEIMYNPLPGSSAGEAFEFIELQNVGANPIDLTGFSLEGVTYSFPPRASLTAGAIIVLASDKNPAGFAVRYPALAVAGYFGGNLANGGERLAVLDAQGRTITSVDYDDENGWPTAADGSGPSLEIVDVNGDPDDPANWRASAAVDGNPGVVNPAPGVPAVRINEVMAENAGAVTNAGTFPDWVELHNAGVSTAYITNWSLSDDGNPRKFVFPAGTAIPAGGYLIVWLDSATALPGLHSGFALSRTGEGLYLFDANTNRVDAVTFGPQLPNATIARSGTGWVLGSPTPGLANVAAPVGSVTNLVLNEWLASASPGTEDWLELHNRSQSLPIALRGIYLATSNDLYRLGSLSFIAPGAHLRLWADKLPGPDHLDFKLPAEGGRIALYDNSGLEIDQVQYSAQQEAISEGRLPDGAALITAFPGTASPGASNFVVTYAGPLLNEILARNLSAGTNPAGRFADWVELYNPGSSAFNLSGMSLSIDSRVPGQWTFPPGLSIPANGFLVVWCDEGGPATTNLQPVLNTGRSINNNNGAVYLFNPQGRQVDAIEFGFQIPDLSLGRTAGTWQLLAAPTPAEPNLTPAALGSVSNLRINEWMARPTLGDDWFELYNIDFLPVDLAGLYLTDDPSIFGQTRFQVPALSFIGPGAFVQWMASGSPGQGRNHVNFSLNGEGEMIGLYANDLAVIDAVYFGPQNDGVSEGRFLDGAPQVVSFPGTATPGLANVRALDYVVINEVLTHTDPPLEDAIELRNLSATNVNISGWFLSDDPANPKMYRLPNGSTLGPHGFRVIYELDFNGTGPDCLVPFALSSARGDAVYLSTADEYGNLTGYRAEAEFGPAANGVSFGRHPTSDGVDFTTLSARTFGVDNPNSIEHFRLGTGRTNALPLIGPVIINEFMYAPPTDLDQSGTTAEYIELYNVTNQPVALHDPAFPTNRWAILSGVQFTFPPGISIPARGHLVLVGFDPVTDAAALSAFRSRYSFPDTVPVLGPFSGRLNDTGESLELFRPDTPQGPGPDVGLVPMILVDRIRYTPLPPWPALLTNGMGQSLQRFAPTNYGNDPLAWQAAAPSPGRANLPVDLDTDADGMPDWWELAYGFNPQNPADAGQDPDGNHMNNLQEFVAGTNPLDPGSSLAITSVQLNPSATRATLQFVARPGRAYTVEFRDNLAGNSWQKLSNVPLDWTTRQVEVTDPDLPPAGQRYYRIRTPALP